MKIKGITLEFNHNEIVGGDTDYVSNKVKETVKALRTIPDVVLDEAVIISTRNYFNNFKQHIAIEFEEPR